MKIRIVSAAILAALVSISAFAQVTPPPAAPPVGSPAHLTKEERIARRQEMKATMASMTPEERRTFKESRREKLREKWASMTPEQRDKAKARFQERRERRGKPTNK